MHKSNLQDHQTTSIKHEFISYKTSNGYLCYLKDHVQIAFEAPTREQAETNAINYVQGIYKKLIAQHTLNLKKAKEPYDVQ